MTEVVYENRPAERVHEPAKRFDAGKPRVDLIPPEFMEALGRHYGVGSEKYGERNWERGMSWSRVYASAMRHLLAFWRGEENDAETGTPHVIAAAWNLAALHYYAVYHRGTDDRPINTVAALDAADEVAELAASVIARGITPADGNVWLTAAT